MNDWLIVEAVRAAREHSYEFLVFIFGVAALVVALLFAGS